MIITRDDIRLALTLSKKPQKHGNDDNDDNQVIENVLGEIIYSENYCNGTTIIRTKNGATYLNYYQIFKMMNEFYAGSQYCITNGEAADKDFELAEMGARQAENLLYVATIIYIQATQCGKDPAPYIKQLMECAYTTRFTNDSITRELYSKISLLNGGDLGIESSCGNVTEIARRLLGINIAYLRKEKSDEFHQRTQKHENASPDAPELNVNGEANYRDANNQIARTLMQLTRKKDSRPPLIVYNDFLLRAQIDIANAINSLLGPIAQYVSPEHQTAIEEKMDKRYRIVRDNLGELARQTSSLVHQIENGSMPYSDAIVPTSMECSPSKVACAVYNHYMKGIEMEEDERGRPCLGTWENEHEQAKTVIGRSRNGTAISMLRT